MPSLHCSDPSSAPLPRKANAEGTVRNRYHPAPAPCCITRARVHSTSWAPLGHRPLSHQVNRNALPLPCPPSAPSHHKHLGAGSGGRLAETPLLLMLDTRDATVPVATGSTTGHERTDRHAPPSLQPRPSPPAPKGWSQIRLKAACHPWLLFCLSEGSQKHTETEKIV